MREVVFVLEFRGQAGPVPGQEGRRRARSRASSQVLRTVLRGRAVEARVETMAGDDAVLDSEVQRFGDGTFVETGSITYGELGTVFFETAGRGVVEAGVPGGWTHGAAVWTITGGAGGCEGARGLITSNFAVSPSGEVIDYHVARLLLPPPVAMA